MSPAAVKGCDNCEKHSMALRSGSWIDGMIWVHPVISRKHVGRHEAGFFEARLVSSPCVVHNHSRTDPHVCRLDSLDDSGKLLEVGVLKSFCSESAIQRQ